MSKFYTEQSWIDTFKPIKNPRNNWGEEATYSAFETYGEDVEFVKNVDNKFIWTEVDGDSGCYIISGYHFVNRIQYFVTENPWDDEWTEVPTWCYRRCDCTDEEGFEDGNPDCKECEDGDIDIPCHTVEDLKAIYGEDAPIVS
jgi:hypothetical protein